MGAIEEHEQSPDARFDAVAHWFRQVAQSSPEALQTLTRIHRYLEQHPDRMDAREIQSAASNAVAAGADTVACGLQAFVYHVIRRPDMWERVREEIDNAGVTKRVISFADAQGLPVLQRCIKEALGIFGPVPMGLPRVAGKGGLTIGGRTLPKGTTVSVNAWVIHHSKEIWGPDAREFRPERWLKGDKCAPLEKYYMPVSLGSSYLVSVPPNR